MPDLSAAQAAAGIRDQVYNAHDGILYLATASGEVLRWDVAGQAFLAPIVLGGELTTLDITADGQQLLVGRADVVNATGDQWEFVGETVIDRVDTSSLAVTPLSMTVTGYDRGVANLAVGHNDQVFVTNGFAGSGWVPLRTFPADASAIGTEVAGALASVRQSSFLIPSEDDRYILILEQNISSGPVHIYDTQTGQQTDFDYYSLALYSAFHDGRADISSAAGLAAVAVSGEVHVFDLQMDVVRHFSGAGVTGIQFTQDGRQLLLWSAGASSAAVYDTSSWDQVGTLSLASIDGASGDSVDLSADGRFLFVRSSSGFEIVDLESRLTLSSTGSALADTLRGSVGDDTLTGGDGDDLLSGYGGDDTLSGQGDADVLDGGQGDDTLDGGEGIDTATYAGLTAGVAADLTLDGAQDTIGGGIDTLAGIENLIGGDFGDTLTGDEADNVLSGQGGDDHLSGGLGDDILIGAGGNDTLNGGDGTDTVSYAGTASNVVVGLLVSSQQNSGGGGIDTIVDVENLIGTAFNDLLEGNSGANRLDGGEGDDSLEGLQGDDTLIGGSGRDSASYRFAGSGVTVDLGLSTPQATGGAGTDTLNGMENLVGSAFDDQLTGDAADNVLEGGEGDDTLNGGGGDDTINSGEGNDTINADEGDDTISGDGGEDTASYASAASGVNVALSAGAHDTGGAGTDTLTGIENLIGSAFGDTLTGDANANILNGGLGDDVLAGNGGADHFDGGEGTDTVSYAGASGSVTASIELGDGSHAGLHTFASIENLTGSNQSDFLWGDDGDNVLNGGGGDDALRGRGGNDTFMGGDGNDSLAAGAGASLVNGGSGSDVVGFVDMPGAVVVSLAQSGGQATGHGTITLVSIESITGSSFNDLLTGNSSDNNLWGALGDDTLDGGLGADFLSGEAGQDTVSYASATSAVSVALHVTVAQNTGAAGWDTLNSIENLTGSAFNDTLTGDAGDNILSGGDGDDVLAGGAGADFLYGGSGVDTVSYASASARVIVNLGAANVAYSDEGNDTLDQIENVIGSAFNDMFSGSAANNIFNGGGGIDEVVGGANGGFTASLAISGPQNTGEGSDTFISIENLTGNNSADRLTGNNFNNVLIGYAGDDVLEGGGGTDELDGGTGSDTATYASAQSGVSVNLSLTGVQNTLGAGVDTILNVENLTGSNFNDILAGNAGDNILVGGGGTDTVSYASASGAITLDLALSGAQVTGGAGTDTVQGFEVLIGSSFDDALRGGIFNDTIEGGNGDDVIGGGLGNDILGGGDGFDTVDYRDANSGVSINLALATAQATGGGGNDTLSGFEAIVGSSFNDQLSGQGEVNTFTGRAGNDTIFGGANVDTAVFAGARSAYAITQTDGVFTIVGPDGTDTLTDVEFAQFDDETVHLRPGTGSSVNFAADPDSFMGAIRDFDGNDLGGAASWDLVGSVDLQGDGDLEYLFFNREISRWASVGPAEDGMVYFNDHGWAGDTRVVGIYIDPLVESGDVVQGSDHDSQRRFSNDLAIGNINGILGADDYDGDGLQEVYFSLTDGTAYLHAYMHADGNIRYANYQNQQQVIDYLADNGFGAGTYEGWFD